MTNNVTASGDALVLQCNDNSNFKPHAPGIWQAVCVDVIDLGLVWTEFQGKRKLVRKLKLVFETECVGEDGKRGIVTKNFTASVQSRYIWTNNHRTAIRLAAKRVGICRPG